MASSVESTWLANNAKFVESFKEGDKPLPPAKKVCVVLKAIAIAFAFAFCR